MSAMQAARFEAELREQLVREHVSVERVVGRVARPEDWRVVDRMLLVSVALSKVGVLPDLEKLTSRVLPELLAAVEREQEAPRAVTLAHGRLRAVAMLCSTQRSIATRVQYLEAQVLADTVACLYRAQRGSAPIIG